MALSDLMSAGMCVPINSALLRPFASSIVYYFFIVTFLDSAEWSSALRLTNMNAPLVADLRDEMVLDCHFDMGVEELYAVKWYKDNDEFFRYAPHQKPATMSFPVAGVHLMPGKPDDCNMEHCKVRLERLTRDHSGGAYKCEISSEAPAFRLASETHNVTVAALPRENPKIEGLTKSYTEGDIVEAKCVSDPSDPAPILSWYINGHQAPRKYVGEMTTKEVDGLVSRALQLRFLIDKKYSRTERLELRCVSTLPGILLPPQVITVTVPLRRAEVQVINNEKLHWFNSDAIRPIVPIYMIVCWLIICIW